MRTDTLEFSQYNNAASQEPVFVVEVAFDDAGTDVIYLTSHTVSGLAGEIFEAVLTDISGTTQKINPDKALSEIGALSFSALDDNLTAKQRTKLNAGLGLRGKRARFYAGFQGMDWADYTLVQTQIIRSASYKDLVYSWKCSDIQREMRKNVFEVKSTALAKTLEPGDTEVEVYNTDGFKTVKQPPSPSGKTDAPGQKVGYIILEGDDRKEIIRYTGTTPTKFTGCTRGVLGTRPIRVEKSDDEGADNAPKVEEYVYLEMPAPMLAYAILTGSIYGEPGETLPDHWHLGIKPEYIRTADYVGIGEDLWDLDNPDNGLAARIAGVTDEDGKQFVEEELFLLLGCYAPIYSNGEIGLRRMTGVLSGASSIRTLDRTNITDYSSLEHDMGAIINRIVIAWNWVDQREEYTRTNLLIDQFSIDTHGDADLKQLEFRALHGSRHSYNTLRSRFDALRDRYAGPPLRLSLDLMPDQNDLEVGDIVRVQLDEIEDYTGETVGIDRAFEVQQAKVNWKTGAVSVELFGSSQKAEPLPPAQEGAALPNEVYAVPGATEISAANFPGKVSSSGGITSITGDISLVGQDDLRSASAIYYCLEDLTINAGVTVTINKNTQIRVKGFFQINGKIDGRGRGFPGAPRALSWGTPYKPLPEQRFFGSTISQLGADFAQGYEFSNDMIRLPYWSNLDHRAVGKVATSPEFAFEVAESNLSGMPVDITGQPGSHGCPSVYYPDNNPGGANTKYGYGGAGGAGGAGVIIVSSGAEFGATGLIDTSGGDGEPGGSVYCAAYTPSFSKTLFGGRGAAGMPGAAYWLIVGATSSPPTLTQTTAVAEAGATSADDYSGVVQWGDGTPFYFNKSAPGVWERGVYAATDRYGTPSSLPSPLSFERRDTSGRHLVVKNLQKDAYRVQFLNGEIAPEPDLPEYSEKPSSLTVTEALNTPKTPNANLSTLEVSVTAPADSAYSHALVEYRPQGDTGWTNAGPASPEALITVASDGTTYDIRARSVSTSGLVSDDFVTGQITTTKIIGAEPGDPDVDDKIIIPAVRGLELEGQGNETEFGGRDAKFVWRATTVSQWFEIGSEGQLGASAGELDLYFRDYQVEVWAQNRVVRTEWVKDPAFVYTYEKNAEDYARENLSAGAWRSFEVRVYCRGRLNQVSERPARLEVTNHPPMDITGLAVTAGFNVIELVYQRPTDLDFAGVQVWISETSGFDPGAVEPTATISDNSYVAGGLQQGKNYFVRLRPFDDFGIVGTIPTAEIMVTTRTGQDITGLSGWAYEVDPVDRAFIEANIAGGAIDLGSSPIGGQLVGAKIEDLAITAGKLAGSSVTAEKISNLAVGTAAIANGAITNAKIENLAVTSAKIKDAAITTAKIGNAQITDAKIIGLTAAKITTGTLNATATITSEGVIRAVSGSIESGLGPRTIDGVQYLKWAFDGAKPLGEKVLFGVTETGGVVVNGTGTFQGTVNISGGAVIGDLSVTQGGSVKSVKSNYADSAAGWWLGDDAGTPKLNIGDLSSYLKWDGSRMYVQGLFQTAPLGSGKRLVIDSNFDNLEIIDDLNDDGNAVETAIRIGRRGGAYNDTTLISVGNTSANNNVSGIGASSASNYGVIGNSVSWIGVSGASTHHVGVMASGGALDVGLSKIGLAPSSPPSVNSGTVGFKTDLNGDLWWWNGTTWTKLN